MWHHLPLGLRALGQPWGQHCGAPQESRLGPSLQLDQEKPEQGLALLRQRAEQEVWETQKALDQLLFKHQLEVSWPAGSRGLHGHGPLPATGQCHPACSRPKPRAPPDGFGSGAACGPPALVEGQAGEGVAIVSPKPRAHDAWRRTAWLPDRGQLRGPHTDAQFKADTGRFSPQLTQGLLAEDTDDRLSRCPGRAGTHPSLAPSAEGLGS